MKWYRVKVFKYLNTLTLVFYYREKGVELNFMAKRLNSDIQVGMSFVADTSSAQKAIQQLNSQIDSLLTKHSNPSNADFTRGLTEEARTAQTELAKLKVSLEGAVNANTGKLDLSQFHQSLKATGTNLDTLKTNFSKLGLAGDKAFANLTKSIVSAETPIKKTNGLLNEFATTLKNTARWQISSSILHGFMGSIQHAYYYAQDLNESLNNIRIVTSNSTDEMARFAKQANEAAKSLSTTTTQYTDAALIYYQQGLNDKQVKERTDVTMKMANVAGESAQTVSDQMTAVWNNFDDGSQSLEHYADVLTALGAATASSTSEITEGLEKFAATANTVGLSYEYATSALATVTATTRQSADVVGTSFKTLFARIQGLQLGNTLDDGTDLNKYSKALASVGISIKEENGEMKKMDTILDEMGAKWGTLAKDQQVALAETVAGVRQYTQMIALMDHWDFFKENLETANNSTGTLQEQADIYAESWEAASKRVKAAAETIYSDLLNDDFFISLTDGLAKVLEGVDGLIKGLGGVPGILGIIGTVSTRVFKTQIASGIKGFTESISGMFGGKEKEMMAFKEKANTLLTQSVGKDMQSETGKDAVVGAYEAQMAVQDTILKKTQNYSEEQKRVVEILQQQHQLAVDIAIETGEAAEAAEKEAKAAERRAKRKDATFDERQLANARALGEMKDLNEAQWASSTGYTEKGKAKDLARVSSLEGLSNNISDKVIKEEYSKALKNLREAIENEQDVEGAINDFYNAANDATDNIKQDLVKTIGESEEAQQALETAINAGEKNSAAKRTKGDVDDSTEETQKQIEGLQSKTGSFADNLSNGISGVVGLSSVLITLNETIKTLGDDTASTGEKVQATVFGFGSAGMELASMAPEFTELGTSLQGLDGAAGGLVGKIGKLASGVTPLVAGIGAVAAALGVAGLLTVIGLVIKDTIHLQHTAEGALEKAQAKTKGLEEELSRAEDKANSLRSAFDNYQSVTAQLDQCKKGTEEWEKAVMNVNSAVLELMGNANLLSTEGLFTTDEDGNFVVDEKKFEEAVNKADQQKMNTQLALGSAKNEEQRAGVAVDLKNLAGGEEFTRQKDTPNGVEYRDINLYDMASQLANGMSLTQDNVEDLQWLAGELGKSFEELSAGVTAASEKIKSADISDENVAKGFIANNVKGTKYENDEGKQKELQASYSQAIQKEVSALEEKYDKTDFGGGGREKELLQKYNAATGNNYKDLEIDGWHDGKRTVTMTDQNGEKVVVDENLQSILSTIATNTESLQSIDDFIKETDATTEKLKEGQDEQTAKNLDGLGQAVKTGSMDSLSVDTMKKLSDGIDLSNTDSAMAHIGDKVAEVFGKSENELAEEYGMELEDFKKMLVDSLREGMGEVKSAGLDKKGALNGLDTSMRSEGLVKSENAALDNALTASGEKAKKALTAVFAGVPVEIQEKMKDFDWSSVSDLESVEEAFKAVGYTVGPGSSVEKNLQAYIELMNQQAEAVDAASIDDKRKEARADEKAIEEVKANGSISADSFGALSDDLQEFFTEAEDGTYKLTASTDEWSAAVERSQQAYKNAIEGSQKVIDDIEAFRQSGGNTSKDLTVDATTMEGKGQQQAQLKSQIDAIKMLAPEVSDDKIAELRERAKSKSEEEVEAVSAEILEILKGKLGEGKTLNDAEEAAKQAAVDNGSKDAFLAKDASELDEKYKNNEINEESYNNALNSMNNTTDTDLDSEKVKEYGEALSDAAKDSEIFDEDLQTNKESAEDVAESLMRYDDAVKDVSESYDSWKTAIDNIDETGGILDPDTVNGLTDAYGDMFDMDASQLSDGFLKSAENLDLLKQAAEGSEEAYNQLQSNIQDDILQVQLGLNGDDLADIENDINSFVNDTEFQKMKIGADIEDGPLMDKLNDIINASGMTAAQAQELLSTMGIDAELEQVTKDEPQEIPAPTVTPVPGAPSDLGDKQVRGYSTQVDTKTVPMNGKKTATALKIKTAKKTSGGNIKTSRVNKGGGGGGGGGGKKGGGGGSAPSTVKKTKTEIDRYWDINNAISKTSHEMEKLAKAKEKMSGTELIDALTKENKLLEQQKKNYQALLKEQQKELSEVIGKIKKKGGSFSGNKLKNYKSLMKKAGQKLHKKENAYNKWTKTKEAKGKKGKAKNKKKLNGVKKAQEAYAELEKLVSRYQQLQYDAIEETKAKMEELLVQEIENNFEKFEIRIKVKADMQDLKKDLNDIQTLFKTDFTKAADDAANWATKMNGAVKNFSTLFSGKTMEQNRKKAQDKLDKYNAKARADQILAAQHEDNKKALQTKADKDYESAKKSKAKRLVKGLSKKQRKKLYKKFGGKKNLNKKIDEGDKKAINAAFKADFDKKENARIKKLKKKDLKKLKKVKGKSAKAKLKKKTYKKKKFKDTDNTSWAKKKKKKINKKLNKDIAADKKKLGVKGLKVKEVTDPLGKLVQNFGSNSALTSLYDQFTKLNAEKDHFMNGGKKDKTFISTSLSDATEKLKENGKQILDELQQVYNQAKETWDTYLQGVEGVIAEQDKIRSQLDDLYSSLENRGSIAELLWDTNSSAYLNKNEGLIKQQMQIKAKEVQDLNVANKYYQDQMWKILHESGGTIYDEDYLKYQEKVRANKKQIESDTIERIKLEQSLQQNSINKALNNLDNSIWGKSFEEVKQDWEETLAFQDKYLSKAQATYKIQSLSNTIQKDIDNTKDLKIQQKLNDFREEEIAHLREKNKLEGDNRALTQDDVDLAQARYDILLKEIALENARNNKNSMKVVRNQEGNWSYQYVADNGDVEDKQQQLLDSWAAYNEKADEAYKNATQLAMDEYQTHRDKLAKMAQDRKYYNEQGLFETTKFNDDMKAENDKYMAHIKTAFENSASHQKEVTYSTVGTLAEAYKLDEQNVMSYTAKEEQAVESFGNAGVSAYGGIKKELTRVFGEGGEGETAINDFNKDTIPSLATTASAAAIEAGKKWGTPEDTSKSKTFCGYFKAAMEACQASAETYFKGGKDTQGITGILDDAKKSAGDLTTGITNLNTEINKIDNTKLNEFKKGLDDARESAHNAKSAIGEIAGVIDSVAEELKKVAEEVKAVGDATKKKPKKYSKKWYKSEIKTYKGFKNAKTNEAKVDYLKGLYKDKKNDKKYQGWLKEKEKLKGKMNKTKKEKNRLKELKKKIKHRKNYLKAIDELKKKYAGKIEGASKAGLDGGTDNQSDSQTTNDDLDIDTDTNTDDDETQTGTDAETIQDGVAAGLSSVLPNDFAQKVIENTAEAIQQQQSLLDKTDENTPKIAENTANLANVTSEVKGTINDIQRSIAEDIKSTLSDILTSEKDFISKFDLMSKNLENKEFNNIYNINADFPNAKDVDTIKQAILSLPNLVSQKNNSKTKKKK